MTMPDPTRIHQAQTHRVTNQPPERGDQNEYTADRPLVEAVHAYGAGWAEEDLRGAGAHVGSRSFRRDAELADRREPVLHTHDRYGNRIDEVEYDDAYHRVIAAAVARGAHTAAWQNPRPGASVARAATFMLFAQVEPGHACPVSMTHAAVAALRAQHDVAAQWEPRMLSRSYDPTLRADKPSALFGMAMTEKQGGSDVRAGTTTARESGDTWLITGHKWFCSAPMSDAFLVLAQTGEGLGCFLVPRVLPDGARNVFRLQRLKDKLGNRSNASAEVEFDGTVGHLVGEPGRGVRTIIEMVSRTRLDCVLGSTAGMRQGVTEAIWHTGHRSAFGRPLIAQPAMRSVLADLALETEAATLLSMRLAAAYEHDADESERLFRRLATTVGKYWVCKRGPGHAYEALECLGGNGYTEGFPLARRYREQPVMAIWEGSGNVIALDVLRAIGVEGVFDAFWRELEPAIGADRTLDRHLSGLRERVGRLVGADADTAAFEARSVTEALALALQAALLVRHAPSLAGVFIRSRIGRGSALYGGLDDRDAVGLLLQRASGQD